MSLEFFKFLFYNSDPSKSKKQNLKLFPKSSTSKSQEQLDDPIQQLTDEVSPTKKIDTYTMDAETPPAHISEPFDNELESVALEEHVIDQNENMLKNLAEKSTGQYVLKKHNGVMQRTKRGNFVHFLISIPKINN